MIDFSYNNVAGVMKGSERTVLSGDVNVSYRKKSFLFRNILSVSNTRSDNSPWGDFGDYARMNPYWSAVDPQTGQIARWAYDEVANPMYDATLGTLDRETYTSVTNNFYAEWQATEALKLTARLGIAVKRSDADEFYPAKHSKFATSAYESTSMQLRKGSYQLDNGKSSDISGEIYANYAKNWGRHYLYVNAGGPDRRKHVQRLPALRRGIPQQPDGQHHLRPAVRPGQKARRHLVDHARNQFPGNRVVQLRRPLQRRPHVPRKRLVALRRPTTAGRRHGAPAWRGTSTTNPSCAIRTF